MDPNNPVVKLCAQGIEVEMNGRRDEARALFLQAWELRQDDVDACIAAHYVARHQETPAETLRWNKLALQHAISASADDVPDGGYGAIVRQGLHDALQRVRQAGETEG